MNSTPILSRENIVIVIFDEKTKRLRAKALGFKGFIRFPKALREPGAIYRVEKLTALNGGRSWNASGEIKRVA